MDIALKIIAFLETPAGQKIIDLLMGLFKDHPEIAAKLMDHAVDRVIAATPPQ